MIVIMRASRPATIGRTARAAAKAPRRAAKSSRETAKSKTHSQIVAAASRLMRKRGLAAASVSEVMRGAGLTVGGFYAHFPSKTAMDAEVLRKTLAHARANWFAGIDRSDPREWVAKVVERYLAPSHRDRSGDGCPLPAVLSELARTGKGTRRAMADGFEAYAREFASCAPELAGVAPRERALATLALCVGGLAIARALRGHPVSDETLRACANWALPEAREPGAPPAAGPRRNDRA